eukprot:GHVT01048241.1.p1 GENE.GHVT01048241.1~~GHVT01048241.1.p1  ORF type:complete len:117 (-),score=7.04 GHVT01048241.1:2332-2682(-)
MSRALWGYVCCFPCSSTTRLRRSSSENCNQNFMFYLMSPCGSDALAPSSSVVCAPRSALLDLGLHWQCHSHSYLSSMYPGSCWPSTLGSSRRNRGYKIPPFSTWHFKRAVILVGIL